MPNITFKHISPCTLSISDDGYMNIGGVNVRDLISRYKTPLYVIDEETLRSNCRSYINSLNNHIKDFTVAYGAKACLTKGILSIIKEEGLGNDKE